jgi:hypothetical protein
MNTRIPLLPMIAGMTLLLSFDGSAQLAPPNDLGVRLGHIHLTVKDVEAQKQFWTSAMGGTLVTNGPLSMIEFPGIYIMLRQGEPNGPPAGSIVDHFGFVFKDLPSARARWKANQTEITASIPGRAALTRSFQATPKWFPHRC